MELNKTFKDGLWSKEINVTDFVKTNITPYEGDASFLAGPTERTKRIWSLCLDCKLLKKTQQSNSTVPANCFRAISRSFTSINLS